MNRTSAVSVGRDLVGTIRTQQVSFLSASLAYYMFVSVLPLLLLVVLLTTIVAGTAFAAEVIDAVGAALTPESAALLETALLSASGRGGATVLTGVVMLWGALKVFRAVDLAFSRIYGTTGESSFVDTVQDALAALVGIGLALVGFVAVGSLGAVFGVDVALSGLALVPLLVVAFLPLYYLFPDAPMTVRAALPGTVLAAVGWTALATGFGLYASVAGSYQLYGVIGGVLLLVTWFYFAGQLLLVGAALNAVLAGVRDRQLQHEALRLSDKAMSDEADSETPPPSETGAGEDMTDEELAQLREEFESFRDDVEDRTLHRDDVEGDLKKYIRRKTRRGHARGWGPYIVLLYGTVMTLGAFYYLNGLWAVLAMLVVWLSTLGLYVVFVVVGLGVRFTELPGSLLDRVRDWRE